jgi:DNA-binding beta-propeller fold protein YncE
VLLALLIAACGGSTPNSAVSPAAKSPISSPEAWQKVATAEGEVTGVAVDGLGNIYAAEVENDQIEKFGRDGKRLARWGQSGSGLGQLSRPAKIAVDAAGNVYVSEPTSGGRGNDRIQKFSPDGVALAVWGTHGSGPGQFDHPVGLVLDRQGNIYVADQYNKRIQKLSADGRPLAQWGGPGTAPGQSFSPYGIAVDAEGNVFLSDVDNFRIQKFSASGQPLAQWGHGGIGPGEFSGLRAVLVDAQGNIYVGDTGNNRIQKLSPKGDFVAQWAGPHQTQLCCFGGHTDIAMDAQGNLYASVGNSIVKIALK